MPIKMGNGGHQISWHIRNLRFVIEQNAHLPCLQRHFPKIQGIKINFFIKIKFKQPNLEQQVYINYRIIEQREYIPPSEKCLVFLPTSSRFRIDPTQIIRNKLCFCRNCSICNSTFPNESNQTTFLGRFSIGKNKISTKIVGVLPSE